MKRLAPKILIWILIFQMVLPVQGVFAATKEVYTGQKEEKYTEEKIKEIRQDVGNVEVVISTFAIMMGDYAQKYLSQIFKDEITIDKIIYNKVDMLNANLFDSNEHAASSDVATAVKKTVNQWFSYLKRIAIIVMLIALVGAGIKILLNTPEKKAAAQDTLKRVILGFALIFFFPYIMKYALDLNEALVKYIAGGKYDANVYIGSPITQKSDLKPDEIEFRSPKYVSTQREEVDPGSIDATKLYIDRVEEYQQSVDIMRLMRACAGVTLKFVYVVLWYVLLAQTYILAVIYIKRFLMIAFLIAVYPIVVMGYVVEGMVRNGKGAFNTWCKHYFANVFLQAFHAIIYGITSQIIFNQIQKQFIAPETTNLNVILMIICTSFLFSGEKIINRFWKASTSTSGERRGLREIFGAPRRILGNLKGK